MGWGKYGVSYMRRRLGWVLSTGRSPSGHQPVHTGGMLRRPSAWIWCGFPSNRSGEKLEGVDEIEIIGAVSQRPLTYTREFWFFYQYTHLWNLCSLNRLTASQGEICGANWNHQEGCFWILIRNANGAQRKASVLSQLFQVLGPKPQCHKYFLLLPLKFSLFFSWHFNYRVTWCGSPWIHLVWDSLCFLDLNVSFLPQVWKVFSHYFFK